MIDGVHSDANRAVYAASMGAKPKPRFPIVSYFVSLFVTIKGEEIGFDYIEKELKVTVPARLNKVDIESTSNTFRGVGAYIDSTVLDDLECNNPRDPQSHILSSHGREIITSTANRLVDNQQNETVRSGRLKVNSLNSVSSNASISIRSFNAEDGVERLDKAPQHTQSIVQGGQNRLVGKVHVSPTRHDVHIQAESDDASISAYSVDYSFPSSISSEQR